MKQQPGHQSDSQPDVSSHEIPDSQTASEIAGSPETQYLEGARLHLLTTTCVLSHSIYWRKPTHNLAICRLCLCLFLTNLEIPIVSTSLVSIAGELGGLEKLYWITTAYMLGYAGT